MPERRQVTSIYVPPDCECITQDQHLEDGTDAEYIDNHEAHIYIDARPAFALDTYITRVDVIEPREL